MAFMCGMRKWRLRREAAESSPERESGSMLRQQRPRELHLINGLFDAHRNHAPGAGPLPPTSLESQVGMEYFQARIRNSFFKECSA